MTETTLSWTPANWITVVLMVALGYAALGLISQAYMRAKGASA